MNGIERIAAERKRQIEQKGYTPEHDREHKHFELTAAAIAYALHAAGEQHANENWWPFPPEAWRPSDDPIRDLEKAGALIAAEIDRLLAEQAEE